MAPLPAEAGSPPCAAAAAPKLLEPDSAPMPMPSPPGFAEVTCFDLPPQASATLSPGPTISIQVSVLAGFIPEEELNPCRASAKASQPLCRAQAAPGYRCRGRVP